MIDKTPNVFELERRISAGETVRRTFYARQFATGTRECDQLNRHAVTSEYDVSLRFINAAGMWAREEDVWSPTEAQCEYYRQSLELRGGWLVHDREQADAENLARAIAPLAGDARTAALAMAGSWHGTLAELVEMALAVAGATPAASEPVRELVPAAGHTPALTLAADLAGLAELMAGDDVDGCDACGEPFAELDELAAGGRCRQCAAELVLS